MVVAPPGAGKSTVVPLALLDEPWLRGGKIVMLEPRRLAARAVADAHGRDAWANASARPSAIACGSRRASSKRTRIEVVTEGVFTRMLQSDPALEGVAAVLFDEFHERSLHADVGLALALDAQAHLAPELRLLAMSATLDGAEVARAARRRARDRGRGPRASGRDPLLGKGLPALPGGARADRRCDSRRCAPCSAR